MKQKAFFLDRDGVINEDRHYVHRKEDFFFMPGIFSLMQKARTAGYLLIVITNQAGIARGYYSEKDFEELTSWMKAEFFKRNISLDAVYYSPYHPTEGIGAYRRQSMCRKPAPGMLLQAKQEFDLDMSRSVILGDKGSDIEAGKRAKVGLNILIRHYEKPQGDEKADRVIQHLSEAEAFFPMDYASDIKNKAT